MITNRGRFQGLQIGAKRLQIHAGTSNRGKEISNRGRDYKSGQGGFQIGTGITNWHRTTCRLLLGSHFSLFLIVLSVDILRLFTHEVKIERVGIIESYDK